MVNRKFKRDEQFRARTGTSSGGHPRARTSSRVEASRVGATAHHSNRRKIPLELFQQRLSGAGQSSGFEGGGHSRGGKIWSGFGRLAPDLRLAAAAPGIGTGAL